MNILQEQLKAEKAGMKYALLTVVESKGTSPFKPGKKMLLLEDGRTIGTIGGGAVEAKAIEEAAQAVKSGGSFFKSYSNIPDYEEPGLGCRFQTSLFVEVVAPRLLFVVCGGGHVGKTALQLAKILQFTTVLIDSRPEEQLQEAVSFADEFIRCETFEEGLLNSGIPEDAYYLCCAPTHTQDKSSLKGVLKKKFAYVGMLGSIKKRAEMFRQLEAEGIDRELLGRVHTPVGLDICDMSPEEVAFSVLAEVLMYKNGGTGKPNRKND
jgi:xanthine dehydrogenase accessory factor